MVTGTRLEICEHCGQVKGAAAVADYQDGYISFRRGAKQVWIASHMDGIRVQLELTRTEAQILDVLVRQVGVAVSVFEIRDAVWKNDFDRPSLVQAHISGLRKKMKVGGRNPIETIFGTTSYRYVQQK